MNKQPTLLIIVGIFALLLIGYLLFSRPGENTIKNHTSQSNNKLTDNASLDTNNEVLRTVLANQQSLEEENKQLLQQNQKLASAKQHSFDEAIRKATDELQEKLQSAKAAINRQIQGAKREQTKNQNKHKRHQLAENDYGMDSMEDGQPNTHIIVDVPDLSHPIIRPQTVVPPTTSDSTKPNLATFSSAEKSGSAGNSKPIPFYTIPANATLNNLSLMSAIIAEVPVGGKLLAPAFPFKAIVGREDLLAANGLTLPREITGIVVEGYSVGNMTMSCARAYVMRALFVFDDGHFVVFPKEADTQATSLYPKEALGYLTDTVGNTCINGKYISDAPKVIASMAAMGGIAAGADALAQTQLTTQANAFQSNTQLTGTIGKYAAGAFLNGAANKALDWYSARVHDVFDAVYIPASYNHHVTRLVLNITKTIPIDFNQQGRRLDERQGHASTLSQTLD